MHRPVQARVVRQHIIPPALLYKLAHYIFVGMNQYLGYLALAAPARIAFNGRLFAFCAPVFILSVGNIALPVYAVQRPVAHPVPMHRTQGISGGNIKILPVFPVVRNGKAIVPAAALHRALKDTGASGQTEAPARLHYLLHALEHTDYHAPVGALQPQRTANLLRGKYSARSQYIKYSLLYIQNASPCNFFTLYCRSAPCIKK